MFGNKPTIFGLTYFKQPPNLPELRVVDHSQNLDELIGGTEVTACPRLHHQVPQSVPQGVVYLQARRSTVAAQGDYWVDGLLIVTWW